MASLRQCISPAITSIQDQALSSFRDHHTTLHTLLFGFSLANVPQSRTLHVSAPTAIGAGVSSQRLTITAKANPKHQEHQQPPKKTGSTAKLTSRRQTNTRVAVQGYQGGNRTEGDASDEDVARAEDLRDALKEAQFVRWFREAWPYIQGHRGSTFVIVVPGDVVANRQIFDSILQDVALLHGLGVRIVLVPGSHVQINDLLEERGVASVFHGAYRVTDTEALAAAMEASGRTRVDIEAKLSRGPVIPVLRRHGESEKWHEVGISVASGNFVHAKVGSGCVRLDVMLRWCGMEWQGHNNATVSRFIASPLMCLGIAFCSGVLCGGVRWCAVVSSGGAWWAAWTTGRRARLSAWTWRASGVASIAAASFS
ncbi:unnamed protein product [Closterium sp. NIES-54]